MMAVVMESTMMVIRVVEMIRVVVVIMVVAMEVPTWWKEQR